MRAAAYKIRFCMLSNLPRRTGQLCGGFFVWRGARSDHNRHHRRCNILLQRSQSERKTVYTSQPTIRTRTPSARLRISR